MAFVFAVTSSLITASLANFVPVSGAVEGLFKFKEMLKSCGWTVTASSDGVVSFSTSSDVLTTYTGVLVSGSGVTGSFGNKSAWFVVASPANPSGNGTATQYWSFQRDSTNNGTNFETWRVKYASDPFDMLTASLTATPGPPNQQTLSQSILVGGGTDASPTFAVLFRTVGNFRWNSAANNDKPYDWYIAGVEFTAYTPVTLLIHDGLITGSWPDSASFPTQYDTTPYCVHAQYAAAVSDVTPNIGSSTVGPLAWFRRGAHFASSPSGLLRLQCLRYMGSNASNTTQTNTMWPAANTVVQSQQGLNQEVLLPVPYARRASLGGAATGFKGLSSLMKYPAAPRTTGSTYNASFSATGSRDGIKFGTLVLPWLGKPYLY
jgi:hypothetical protein